MRAVIQRVNQASVSVDGETLAHISTGLLVLLGIEETDDDNDIQWLCGKIARLRVFPDMKKVMNLSVTDIDGEVLVVSQFTLHASTKKGNRPSYIRAAPPIIAVPIYEKFLQTLASMTNKDVKSGEFGAMMDISLVNHGPVTIIIDSKDRE
jgi:D-aminoacyl-tRNA deacylase